MKNKLIKTAVTMVAAAACSVTAFSLAGCAKTSNLSGEMHYVQWGTDYGIKVNVQVQSDKKGDRIRKVTVANSDYVSASPAMNGWDPEVWNNNLQTLLNAYRGNYVVDVLSLEVVTDDNGAPLVKTDEGFENFGDNFITTGATLGSGRLLIAVQNALSTLDGYKVVEGEYGYVSWGTNYGVKVRAILKDNVVKRVVALSSEYTNATITTSWDAGLWLNVEEDILAAYEGKTVEQIMGYTATVDGQNGATENSVSESSMLATGATLSSARFLLAVQNALLKV